MRRPPYKRLYEELKLKIPELVESLYPGPLSLIEKAEIADVVKDWEEKYIKDHHDRN